MPARKKTNPALSHQRTAARKALLAGKWAQAVSNYTRALGHKGNSSAIQIELLDGRAGAYKALGKLKEQVQDLQKLVMLQKREVEAAVEENSRLVDEGKRSSAELAVITSVQKALADEFDIQAIYDTVGEKVREIFNVGAITINVYNLKANTNSYVYGFEDGKRTPNITIPINKLHRYVLRVARPTFLLNTGAPRFFKRFGHKAPQGKLPKSALSVKLEGKTKQITAVVLMDIEHENAFTQNDVRLLQALASSMSVALENARLFEETQRLFKAEQQRAAELGIINSVQEGLASKLDIQAIYDLVGKKMRDTFDAETIYIGILEPATGLAHHRYFVSLGKRIYDEPPTRPVGFGGRVIETRKPLLLNHIDLNVMREFGSFLQGKEDEQTFSRSWMGAPIIAGDQVMGVISIQNRREDAFSDSDLRLLTTLTNSMSVALENARLFDEIQGRNREITEALELETATSEILDVIASSPEEIDRVLSIIAEKAALLLKSDDAVIVYVEDDFFKARAHYGLIPFFKLGEGIRFNQETVTGRAIIDGKPMQAIHNPKGKKSEFPQGDQAAKQFGYAMTCAAPLLFQGNAIGAIMIRRLEPVLFSEKDISLLQNFANQAVIAIEKARLLNETKRLLDETTQRNAELAIINSVQQGLASKLDMQAIYELVGYKIREVFNADTAWIALFNEGLQQFEYPFGVDRKRQLHINPIAQGQGLTSLVFQSRAPLRVGSMAKQLELGAVFPAYTNVKNQNQSFLGVPLMHGDNIKGIVAIESYRNDAYTENDVRLLQTLVNAMSVALENARLFDETAQRNAELAVINSVQSALAEQLDIQAIYDSVGEKLREIFDVDAITINVYDLEAKTNSYVYGFEKGKRAPNITVPINALHRYGLDQGKIFLANQGLEQLANRLGAQASQGKYPKSSLSIQLPQRDKRIIGVTLRDYQKENAFSQSNVRLLETIANSMSVALENARLFDETAQRNAELAVINSVQEGLASKLKFQEIIDLVGEKVGQIFKADTVSAMIYDAQWDWGSNLYYVDRGRRLSFPDGPIPRPSLTAAVADSRKPLLLGTLEEQQKWGVVARPPSEEEEDQNASVLFVPILAGEKVIGVISVQSYRTNAFNQNDLHLLQTLANSMSVALENARLFDETAARNAELAVINSVQEAMAKQLDIKGIYEAVGEKIKDIFDAQVVLLGNFDHASGLVLPRYFYENGERFYPDPFPFSGLIKHIISTRKTVVINEDFDAKAKEFSMIDATGTGDPESAVFVPLLAADKVIGGISLQNIDRENAFSASDVRLLETLANGMSVALENARLFDETAQRNAELAVITSVQEALAKELNIHGIYEAVGEKIREIFYGHDVALFIYDPATDMLHFEYMIEKGRRLEAAPLPLFGFSAQVKKTGKSILINENFAEKFREVGSDNLGGSMPKSYVNVPIQFHGKFGGNISVVNIDRENAFTDSDVRLLETLANSMGVALENARLFDETNRLLGESRKKEAELTTVNTVSQAVASELELTSLIELIGEQIRKIFKADIAYLALYDREKDLVEFPYVFGDTSSPLKMGEGIVSQVIQGGKPLLINREEDWKTAEQKIARVGTRSLSYLGVPILAGKRAIGALSVQSIQKEERFNDADVHLLSTIAANVGAAIENARLFAEVARQKVYFETFFQYSPAAVVVVDFNGKVISWNPAAQSLFGYTAEEAIGQDVDSLVAKDPRVEAEARMYTKKFIGEMGRVEVIGQRTRKDGSLVDVEVKGLPIAVEGKMVGLLVIYHDISEIEGARRAAEEANRAKSAFLANMSHELRTPLNAIIGFTRIVRRKGEESLPDKQLENLDKVLVSAEHLLGLINTILDIAKIEAGRMELQLSDFSLVSLVEGCLATAQPLVKPGVSLLNSLPRDLPQMHSDLEKIRQILLNLLSNAAKFTHEGSIRVGGKIKGGMISLSVQDSGIGIAEENLHKIFEEFQQADTTTTREYGGTGLGLSISRSLAHLLGGDLTAASVEGQGSTFTLTIPVRFGNGKLEAHGVKETAAKTSLDPGKPLVLVIDDQPDVFHILQQNLEDAGYQVVGALSGQEGIEKARSLHPFAITLDIMMPHKDGWQVLYNLKSDPGTKNVPVIILTIVDNKPMGFRLGASDYLVKPLNEKAVLDALERLAQSNGGVRPRKLLVIDDDPKIVDMVQQMLEGEDFTIETAADGINGLLQIGGSQPDAILLDLLMPRMDGFQFIDEINKRPQLASIPIIVLTAKSLSNDEQAQLEKSVAAIVKKQGLGSDTLVKKIRQIVPSSRRIS